MEAKKRAMLEALQKTLGVITPACKACGITRRTHYNWLGSDPEYKAAVEDMPEIALDFVESQNYKQIKEGNVSAIIFYLKTKGKSRGYIERKEHDHNHKGKVPFQLIVEKTYESDADDTEEA